MSTNQLIRLVEPLRGKLWDSRALHRVLDDYFSRMGYLIGTNQSRKSVSEMLIRIKPPKKSAPPSIIIEGPPELGLIEVDIPLTHGLEIRKPLSLALPGEDYRALLRDTNMLMKVESYLDTNRLVGAVNLRSTDLSRAPVTNVFVVDRDLKNRQRQLQSTGYELTPGEFRADRDSGSWAQFEIVPEARTAAHGVTNSPAQDSGSVTHTNVFITTTKPRDHLQLGLAYNPSQPWRIELEYSRIPLTTENGASASAGVQREPLGSLSYQHDFVAFDELSRRLSLSATLQSDFQADRLISGNLVDERQNGGTLQSQLDVFHDIHSQTLLATLSAGGNQTSFSHKGQQLGRDNRASVTVGLNYVWIRNGTKYAPNFQLLPSVLTGYSNTNHGWSTKPAVDSSWHMLLPEFCEWDARGHFAWASSVTPTSELCSFGGVDSVRGYRIDAGLGRLTWAVQNEVWLPLRFDWPSVMQKYLHRESLKLAAFADIGGVGGDSAGFTGTHAGVGLGLRLDCLDLATLRFDWAHALESDLKNRGGDVFYFSVTTRYGL